MAVPAARSGSTLGEAWGFLKMEAFLSKSGQLPFLVFLSQDWKTIAFVLSEEVKPSVLIAGEAPRHRPVLGRALRARLGRTGTPIAGGVGAPERR